MNAIIYILLPFLLLACGKPSEELQVSDAPQVEAVTDPTAYASVVMVVLPGGAGVCTGTFISPKAVLTAAHCTQKSGLYTVVAGFGRFTTYVKENMSEGKLEDPFDLSILVLDREAARRSSKQVAYFGAEARSGDRVRIVGYGCNSLDTKLGTGTKRSGTNTIAWTSDYLHMKTPFSSLDKAVKKILGPKDQAGSCFGDSGGPMFRAEGYENALVGVTHAGGKHSTFIESQYLNVARSEIQNFVHAVDTNYSLGIYDHCRSGDAIPGACGQEASLHILDFLREYITALVLKIKNFILSFF